MRDGGTGSLILLVSGLRMRSGLRERMGQGERNRMWSMKLNERS
jgi:hypothetical protein